MVEIDPFAVLAATLAAFLLGGAYYSVLGDRLAAVSAAAPAPEQMTPGRIAVELLRCLILATVSAGLASLGEVDEAPEGLLLGLALWVGFPLVLWVGAVIHESSPLRLAAIHAGDWLLKLIAVGAIVSVLQ